MCSLLCFSIQLDVNTVAAGGGSRLFFRGGMFVVGPESAGAHPGPVCYRKGVAVNPFKIVFGLTSASISFFSIALIFV